MKNYDTLVGIADKFTLDGKTWEFKSPMNGREFAEFTDLQHRGLIDSARSKQLNASQKFSLSIEYLCGTDAVVAAGIYKDKPTHRDWSGLVKGDAGKLADLAKICDENNIAVVSQIIDDAVTQMMPDLGEGEDDLSPLSDEPDSKGSGS